MMPMPMPVVAVGPGRGCVVNSRQAAWFNVLRVLWYMRQLLVKS